jgi:V/A-type H+-transporting ATPase subunit E
LEQSDITDTILQEAKETAKTIIKEAQEFEGSIMEQQRQMAIKDAETQGSVLLKKTANEAEVKRLRKLAKAKITANWIVLSKKEELISAVLAEAKRRLQHMTKTEEYASVLESLIISAGIVLGGSSLQVVLNEADSALSLPFEKMQEEICKKTGSKTKLVLSEEKIQVMGGAILKTANGKIAMDNTYEDIFLRRSRELKSKISAILFQ